MIFTACMALAFLAASAQQNPYIVKTKGAKKSAQTQMADELAAAQQEQENAQDFLGQHFKYYSLCDWKEGMKFMVMPEKYDLVVKTFTDAATGKEVSSMPLKYKIMVYKGHHESSDGHSRIDFECQDNGKQYYYEIPSGSFEDYCYQKTGVPTLAYLGDVDIAREQLMGKTLYTKTQYYRIDTEYDGEGYANWDFRSESDDGFNDENGVIRVEKIDGRYYYEANDGGYIFRNILSAFIQDGIVMFDGITRDATYEVYDPFAHEDEEY